MRASLGRNERVVSNSAEMKGAAKGSGVPGRAERNKAPQVRGIRKRRGGDSNPPEIADLPACEATDAREDAHDSCWEELAELWPGLSDEQRLIIVGVARLSGNLSSTEQHTRARMA